MYCVYCNYALQSIEQVTSLWTWPRAWSSIKSFFVYVAMVTNVFSDPLIPNPMLAVIISTIQTYLHHSRSTVVKVQIMVIFCEQCRFLSTGLLKVILKHTIKIWAVNEPVSFRIRPPKSANTDILHYVKKAPSMFPFLRRNWSLASACLDQQSNRQICLWCLGKKREGSPCIPKGGPPPLFSMQSSLPSAPSITFSLGNSTSFPSWVLGAGWLAKTLEATYLSGKSFQEKFLSSIMAHAEWNAWISVTVL